MRFSFAIRCSILLSDWFCLYLMYFSDAFVIFILKGNLLTYLLTYLTDVVKTAFCCIRLWYQFDKKAIERLHSVRHSRVWHCRLQPTDWSALCKQRTRTQQTTSQPTKNISECHLQNSPACRCTCIYTPDFWANQTDRIWWSMDSKLYWIKHDIIWIKHYILVLYSVTGARGLQSHTRWGPIQKLICNRVNNKTTSRIMGAYNLFIQKI